jgi:transitional endoplasmic reticulum ATPase
MFKLSSNAYLSSDLSPVLRLWFFRILVPLGGYKEFIGKNGFSNDNLAEVLGLGKWIDPADQEFDQQKVRNTLRRLHQAGEKKFGDSSTPEHLLINVERLASLVGLTETDCRILEFAVLIVDSVGQRNTIIF